MPRIRLDFDAVRSIAMMLPGVEEDTIHGAPSLKVRGKLLACPALHKSAEPDSLVVRISHDERAQLMATEPDAYYITEHYANYPMVLARLSQLDRQSLQVLLEKSWQFASAKKSGSVRKSPSHSVKVRASTRTKN
jgi:hypothetical protein